MGRTITPAFRYAHGEGYPPTRRGALDRRTFLRVALAGVGGTLGAAAAGCARAPRSFLAPPHVAEQRRVRTPVTPESPRNEVRLILDTNPDQWAVVRSEDSRFLEFLRTSRAIRDLILGMDRVERKTPGPPTRGSFVLDSLDDPALSADAVADRLLRYYRRRSGRRIPRPDVTLIPMSYDPGRSPGFTPSPAW